ncbi:MAG: coenzyme F420-0:L-glutamate ligase [Erysipelotrichales bacterium]|nr:coenzyme F420-0:L-glutamate ligase [Erysipelotrichales bacterium]
MNKVGTRAFGVKLPIIKQGDNLIDIIVKNLRKDTDNCEYQLEENDIFGLTESIVARAYGQYVTVDDVTNWLIKHFDMNMGSVIVFNPIFSRNRFSIILRAIARAFHNIIFVMDDIDEVGNHIKHDITKVNYIDLYKNICEEESCGFGHLNFAQFEELSHNLRNTPIVDCTLHGELYNYPMCITAFPHIVSLKDICNNSSEWGLLGSNKMGEELLKLYPDSRYQEFVDELRNKICEEFELNNVDVMIYGDGCFKDADSGIWEFADPVVSPAYTKGLEGGPAELKLKYLADDEFKNLSGDKLEEAIKNRISNKNVEQGEMETQGTTPRKYVNLLGSLMDLVSGSGDKGTPMVIVQNYFNNYSS